MALYEITSDNLVKIAETSFDHAGLRERDDLQRLLKKQIDVIAPGTLIVTEEFGEWDESKRRIDLLGLDKNANLVVIELKRTEDGGHMELQAIRYAAMISTMTFERVVDVYARYLARNGSFEDPREVILDFLGWEGPDEDAFAQDVKIVLASANFSKELTTAVMWLNERDLDIRCIRVRPYQDNGRILIDVQQVIPLPEAAEYQVQIKEKEQKVRRERVERSSFQSFWEQLIALSEGKTSLCANATPSDGDCIGTNAGSPGLRLNYVARQHEGRVELYIDRKDKAVNKRIFDGLLSHKEEIDRVFGEPLSWDRLDMKQASRIAYTIPIGGYRDDEEIWPELHLAMIDAMIRLERAIDPFIANI